MIPSFHSEKFNLSHTIEHLSFGEHFPGIVNPLDKTERHFQVLFLPSFILKRGFFFIQCSLVAVSTCTTLKSFEPPTNTSLETP